MDDEFTALTRRVQAELHGHAAWAAYERVVSLARAAAVNSTARDTLAGYLDAPAQPLWAREVAAYALGAAGDRRAFETLVLLLNYRDPARGATAADALAKLGDPRTARAAAALATNPLRTSYARHAVLLLGRLRAPESVPALISTLERLVRGPDHHWPVANACIAGLGAAADERAIPVLTSARVFPELRDTAAEALARIWRQAPPSSSSA
ncbi:HEAT repeat domain-containing protein [Streptomyces sp. A7024]|uniref:HEAT repeat domain-containing protein n=1 Tax=Streptomyces coryli TaxID=1128680 RepID=A0A6G4TZX6_9ACTN|nr:HEAT repeat domain-containing protein [Streptomyces coryli]NGN64678.1 HEAT repeat domain-containing protein [Streptomyces coryli]